MCKAGRDSSDSLRRVRMGLRPRPVERWSRSGEGEVLKRLRSRCRVGMTYHGTVFALSCGVPRRVLRPLRWVLSPAEPAASGQEDRGERRGRPAPRAGAGGVQAEGRFGAGARRCPHFGCSSPCELGAVFTTSILAWCLICSPLIEQMRCRQ